MKIICPQCQKEINVEPVAVWQKNKVTMTLTLTEGHRLQAKTFGGTIENFANLLKVTAKHIGSTIDVMVEDVRFKGNEISVDFVSVLVKTGKESANEKVQGTAKKDACEEPASSAAEDSTNS